jgi:hypothetical protein
MKNIYSNKLFMLKYPLFNIDQFKNFNKITESNIYIINNLYYLSNNKQDIIISEEDFLNKYPLFKLDFYKKLLKYKNNILFDKDIQYIYYWYHNEKDKYNEEYIEDFYKLYPTFKKSIYLSFNLSEELDEIFFQQDITYYIGANEIFANNIVNRALRKIYDIQVKMLNVLRAEVTNYPNVDQVITLN